MANYVEGDDEFTNQDDFNSSVIEIDEGPDRRHRQSRINRRRGGSSTARRVGGLLKSWCHTCFPTNRNVKRISFRHLFTYLAFLLIVCIVSYGMRSEYQFYMTRAMTLYFAEMPFGERGIYFSEISSIPDIWAFLNEIVLPNLFPAVVDGKNVTTSRYILRENYLLGLVRLRLLRVRNDSCKIHEDFQPYIFSCFGEFSEDVEDKSKFGLATGTAWTHHTADELSETSYWGTLSRYDGGGFYEDFGPSFEIAQERLVTLWTNFWIRRATRVVFVDFTVYNANVNLFSIIKFVLELPATGGVWPTAVIRSVNLLRYVDKWDYFVLICEILFCCFTLYYLCEEIVEITRRKMAYVKSFWNILDFTILTMSLVCIAFSIYRYILLDSMLERLVTDPIHYPPFSILAVWQTYYNNMVASLVFLCWIKVFKYLSFNKTMTQLSTTLSKCAKDVGGFGLMFCIVFLAYAQLGYLLFGAQLYEFSRFHLSIFTLLRLILGDFDFDAMRETSRIMGSLYFVSYVFVVFFILLNMFLAIINDTYTEVKAELDKKPDKHEFVVHLKKVYYKVIGFLFRRRRRRRGQPDTESGTSQSHTESKLDSVQRNSSRNESSGSKTIISKVSNEEPDEGNELNQSQFLMANEKVERLSNRVDDLVHELEQVQKALVAKLDAIEKYVNNLN